MNIKSAIYPILLTGLLLTIVFSCKKESPKTVPSITIAKVTNITANTAISGGEVTSDGGAAITTRGVCWSTNQNPTTADSKTSDGAGIGSFTSSIAGLKPGAAYYFRAYAINAVGTTYSSQATCSTLALAPVLTTIDLSSVTSTTASSGGNITSDGGSAITARGVAWSTTSLPTVSLSTKTMDGPGTGSFTSSITGLNPGTNYYIRAYATNSVGITYGNEVSFTTAIKIGDYYQGGRIFYILQSGDPNYIAGQTHGFIAALEDITSICWYIGGFTTTGATSTALGTGNANTNAIIASQGAAGNNAAKLCADYTTSPFAGIVYSDWYLPSKDELNKLYINRNNNIGMTNNGYWSSTEADSGAAWLQYFPTGGQTTTSTLVSYYVRAIRSF
jgi:hypothetical protein